MPSHYFGVPWEGIAAGDAIQIPTPARTPCLHCRRWIQHGDQGWLQGTIAGRQQWELVPVHRGCQQYAVLGHMFGVCKCTGYTDPYKGGIELIRRIDTGKLRP